MLLGACNYKKIGSVSPKEKKYEAIEKMIISYVERKYKPYEYISTNKSDTNFGKSWYVKFAKGNVFKDTYQDFVVRISDHAVGSNRAASQRHIFVSANVDTDERIKTSIDDFLNPGTPEYKYEKDTKIVEGSSLERAIYPWDPAKTKYKKIATCIRKNKKGECIDKYEVEYSKPIFVGTKRPKWKG